MKSTREALIACVGLIPFAMMKENEAKNLVTIIDERSKEVSIAFLGWYALKLVGFAEYIQIVKPLTRSEEIEKALEEFEGKSIDEIFNQFISQQKEQNEKQ